MAFSTTAQSVCCGPVRRQQPAFAVARSVSSSSARQQLLRRGDLFGNLSVRTTSNKLLRWNVAKPGRGGRLLVEAAHSAVPKAAGLFNPANDKVCPASYLASICCRTHTCTCSTRQPCSCMHACAHSAVLGACAFDPLLVWTHVAMTHHARMHVEWGSWGS